MNSNNSCAMSFEEDLDSNACIRKSDATKNLALAVAYLIMIVVGIVGNAIVVTVTMKVILSRKLLTNVYIYVACLSAVDLAYLCAGPFFVVYLLTGTWSFGRLICRLSYICEGLNKTMSIYLLVILSGDRYLAACRPTSSFRYRTIKTAVYSVVCLVIFVFLTNLPIYWYTDVQNHTAKCSQCGIWFPSMLLEKANFTAHLRNRIQKIVDTNAGDNNRGNYNLLENGTFISTTVTTSSAAASSSNIDLTSTKNLEHFYFVFLLFVYFIVPTILIIGFYTKIVLRIRRKTGGLFGGGGKIKFGSKNSKKCSDERSSLTSTSSTAKQALSKNHQNYKSSNTNIDRPKRKHKITKSVSLVVSLYFLCWTPYWILVMITLWSKAASGHSTTFVFFATTVHLMPYVNSCVDPILYAFLNKRLWAAYNFEKNKKRRYFVSSFKKSNFLKKSEDMEKSETSCWQQQKFTTTQFSSNETAPMNEGIGEEHVDPIVISIQYEGRIDEKKNDNDELKKEMLIVFSPDIDQEL